jgi:hypothetical protein
VIFVSLDPDPQTQKLFIYCVSWKMKYFKNEFVKTTGQDNHTRVQEGERGERGYGHHVRHAGRWPLPAPDEHAQVCNPTGHLKYSRVRAGVRTPCPTRRMLTSSSSRWIRSGLYTTVLLRRSGRAVPGISLFHSSQDSTDYITIWGFSPYITIPRFTTPTHWRIY